MEEYGARANTKLCKCWHTRLHFFVKKKEMDLVALLSQSFFFCRRKSSSVSVCRSALHRHCLLPHPYQWVACVRNVVLWNRRCTEKSKSRKQFRWLSYITYVRECSFIFYLWSEYLLITYLYFFSSFFSHACNSLYIFLFGGALHLFIFY